MKRIFGVLFVILLLLFIIASVAHAVEVVEVAADVVQGIDAVEELTGETKIPVEPFTWAALGTIAGCTAFALLFVQLIKAPLDKIWHKEHKCFRR